MTNQLSYMQFDELSRITETMTGRPWDGTVGHLADLAGRQREANEVLTAHGEWLSDIRDRVERSGERWNTVSCRRQSRRDGDLAVIPEWLAQLCERATPTHLLNKETPA